MRILVLLLTLNFLAVSLGTSYAQETSYKLVEEISYYEKSIINKNKYIQERCFLDLYLPQSKSPFPTIVWFHGGGLRGGSKTIPFELKNEEIAVVSVNYRLFPKAKSPAYIEDAAASVAWTFKNIEKYGGRKDLIYVSGHSAGGYLTSMVGLDKRWLEAHHIDANSIAGLIPFSGHTITHFTVREERGIRGEQPIIDDMAPLFHVRSDCAPLVLITGDRDLELLGRYEENAYMMRMMKVAGHTSTELFELQGFNHGGMAKPAFDILLRHVKSSSKKILNRE